MGSRQALRIQHAADTRRKAIKAEKDRTAEEEALAAEKEAEEQIARAEKKQRALADAENGQLNGESSWLKLAEAHLEVAEEGWIKLFLKAKPATAAQVKARVKAPQRREEARAEEEVAGTKAGSRESRS